MLANRVNVGAQFSGRMSQTRGEHHTAAVPLRRVRQLLRRPLETLDAAVTGRDLVSLRVGPKRVHIVNRPELIRQVLEGDSAVFARQGLEPTTERLLAGESIATLDGEEHAERWRIVETVFAGGATETDAERIVACARRLGERWRDGATVDLEPEMADLTVDTMGALIFGRDWPDLEARSRALVKSSREVALRAANPLAPLLWRLPLPVNRRFSQAYSAFRAAVDTLIARRRAEPTPGDDLLGRLITARSADGGELTDDQVRDEAWSYLAQGAPTHALIWLWWTLHRNPADARRVRDELDAVLGDELPTAEHLGRLPTTRAFVLETLRLYPASLGALRRTGEPAALDSMTVPRGRHVLISYWSTHRDGRYWPDPERFDLGRWLDDERAEERRYTYLPFSAGHRRCPARSLGLAMLILGLAAIALDWDVDVVPESVSIGVVPFLHPRGGLPALLVRRAPA